MLQQNLHADQHQDDAACNLRLFLVAVSEEIADIDAADGDTKRGENDDRNRLPDRLIQKCECNSDRKCIGTGSHRQHKHLF